MKRIFFLTILSALLLFPCLAQVKTESDFLQFFVEIKSKNICFGDSTDIVAKLTNVSKTPIVVDIKQIDYIINFDSSIDKPKQDSFESFSLIKIRSPHSKPDFIILQSGESYVKNLNFIFDNEFFTIPQKYRMRISYGQFSEMKFNNNEVWSGTVKSNEVNIFIKKCNTK